MGKLEAKTDNLSDCLEVVLDENYVDEIVMTYSANGFDYNFYKYSDHVYSKEELQDINLLLRILSLYHDRYVMNKKAKEGELISLNTKLPNVHGYMKKVSELANRITPLDSNAYLINLKGCGLVNRLYNNIIGQNFLLFDKNAITSSSISLTYKEPRR